MLVEEVSFEAYLLYTQPRILRKKFNAAAAYIYIRNNLMCVVCAVFCCCHLQIHMYESTQCLYLITSATAAAAAAAKKASICFTEIWVRRVLCIFASPSYLLSQIDIKMWETAQVGGITKYVSACMNRAGY